MSSIEISRMLIAAAGLGLLIAAASFSYVQFSRRDTFPVLIIGTLSFALSVGVMGFALAVAPG